MEDHNDSPFWQRNGMAYPAGPPCTIAKSVLMYIQLFGGISFLNVDWRLSIVRVNHNYDTTVFCWLLIVDGVLI